MRYLLKLADANGNGLWEEVNQYTCENAGKALSDDGTKPRYTADCVVINDDDTMTASFDAAPLRDIAILRRFLNANEPDKVDGGFVRKPNIIKFQGRKGKVIMVELRTGEVWEKKPTQIAA